MTRFALPAVLIALLLASPAAAQQDSDIPAGHRPPPGMCRIWIDGVPAGQQSAPTDCATAIRNRPANGRVIFGDEYSGKEKKKSRIPSGLFGGKDKSAPVKKLRDGDGSSSAELPRVEPPRAQPEDPKKDSKKARKTKKTDPKSDI